MPDTAPLRILIADDQQDIIDALRLLLVDEGYEVTAARSPGEALERLEAADCDLAILDLNYTRDTTSGQEGYDLIERLRTLDPTLPVLVMTAWSSVAGAVEAMRRGARDYIEKPWDDEKLLAAVRTQIELRRAVRRSQRLQEANTRLQRGGTPPFIGDTSGHSRDPADARTHRAVGCGRAHHRRARDGQGGGGRMGARAQRTAQQADGDDECRGPGGGHR